jgi:hypothetical protein
MNVDLICINTTMNVDSRKVAKVSAGNYDKMGANDTMFLEFLVNMHDVDPTEFETFSESVMDHISCELDLGNNESIDYDFEDSSVTFNLKNLTVTLKNTTAPECLRECLSEIYECDEKYATDDEEIDNTATDDENNNIVTDGEEEDEEEEEEEEEEDDGKNEE